MRVILLFWLLAVASPCFGHPVEYQVDSHQAVVVTLDCAAGNCDYQVLRPGETEPFQAGQPDALGRIAFLPDRPGSWTVNAQVRSPHGLHEVSVPVEVDGRGRLKKGSDLPLADAKPLLAGLGLLLAAFGLLSRWRRA